MGYQRESLSLPMQDGLWRPIPGLRITPLEGVYTLEGDVSLLLKMAGVNGMVSFLADRDAYTLPLRYRDAQGVYMKFMWVFKDFSCAEIGYPQSFAWFGARTAVSRMTTADYLCAVLNITLYETFEERPELGDTLLSVQVAVMYEMYRTIVDDYDIPVEEHPIFPTGYEKDDEDAKPIGYTLVFADSVMLLGEDCFVSVPPSKCFVSSETPGKPRTIYPHPSGRDIFQWAQ